MKWKEFDNIPIPPIDKIKLQKILKQRIISPSLRDDKLIWCSSNEGVYKVRNGYNCIVKNCNLQSKDSIIPKAGIFLWAALQKRILTADWFHKLGYASPSCCPVSEKDEETADHILLNYNYAQECWHWLCCKMNWKTMMKESLASLNLGHYI